MKLYNNNLNNKPLHIIDRLPKTQKELDYIATLFPGALVIRKSNNYVTYLYETKVKNLHWYK